MSWIRLDVNPGVDAFEVGSHYGNYPRICSTLEWNCPGSTGLVFLDSEFQNALEGIMEELRQDHRVLQVVWGSTIWKKSEEIVLDT